MKQYYLFNKRWVPKYKGETGYVLREITETSNVILGEYTEKQEKAAHRIYNKLMSELCVGDMFEKVETHQIDFPSDQFDHLIKKLLPFEYKHPIEMFHLGNDRSHKFQLEKRKEKKYETDSRKDLLKRIKAHDPKPTDANYNSSHTEFDLEIYELAGLLKPFVVKGEIPPGEYIVNVCW